MESVNEVLVVSDSTSKDANCSMYDLYSGNLIEAYKEGHSVRNGLDFIGADYLISAFKGAPFIKIWQIRQSGNSNRRMSVPGNVSALAASKCGRYCIAGIGKDAYIWEVATGNLESVIQNHVGDITCVRFTFDGSHFITAGKDAMVFVYRFVDAIIPRDSAIDVLKPRFTWMDHSAEVTDVYVGYIGYYSRVATVSKDMTCRVYELDTGNLLFTLHTGVSLTAVTMDICEYFLFLGSAAGDIFKVNLFSSTEPEMYFEGAKKKSAFVGHKKEITSLCVSQSGKYLVSGSADKECRVWDIISFSCVRTQVFSGHVTNVLTTLSPPGVKNDKHVPHISVNDFKKEIHITREEEECEININSQELSLFHAGTPDQFFDSRVLNCSLENLEKMMKRGDMTLDDLSSVNNEMFSFALTNVFDKEASSSMRENSD